MRNQPVTSFNKVFLAQRLKQIRESQNLSRDEVVSRASSGFARSSLQEWENGNREPKIEYIYDLASIYGIHPWVLLSGDELETSAEPAIKTNIDENYVNIPAYDIKASAGHGMFTEGAESADRHLAFRKRWLSAKGLEESMLAVLFTEGDSMTPTVPEGANIVIDRRRNEAMDGKVYVIRIDDRLYVKRTQWIMNGLRLISDNKQYDPIDITKDDMEANDIEVCGQVIHAAYDLPD